MVLHLVLQTCKMALLVCLQIHNVQFSKHLTYFYYSEENMSVQFKVDNTNLLNNYVYKYYK